MTNLTRANALFPVPVTMSIIPNKGTIIRRHVGKKMMIPLCALFFSLLIPLSAPAEKSGAGVPSYEKSDIASLAEEIGNTMFAYYQFNYQDEIKLISTLQYCGQRDTAEKVTESIPDIATFYKNYTPQQVVYDMISKESVKAGFELSDEKIFESISKKSMSLGQSYFMGYVKGYQTAMETFFDKKTMEPLCSAAIAKADKYTTNKYSLMPPR